MKIIVDAFGGDNAPLEILKGALEAKNEFNIDIIFTGSEEIIKKVSKENNLDISGVEIVNAEQVITMEEEPNVVLKAKSESSMAVGMKLLADGKGDAFVSAGNSGAICVGATLIVKRIKGIKRPGFAPVMPYFGGGCFMLCDGGANIECRPDMLVQYAKMGTAYMQDVMGVENPRVGLANVGTEEHKGTELYQTTYQLLKESGLNFVGNVEGRDIPNGACEVVVCDGFTGNLILKTYEGVALVLMDQIKNGTSEYLFIEIMGCPGGCINGGGQPIQHAVVRNFIDLKARRAEALYTADRNNAVRKSHENEAIKTLYTEYLGKPGSHKAHEILHTSYVARKKY